MLQRAIPPAERATTLFAAILGHYRAARGEPDIRFIVEKTPSNILVGDTLLACFPNSVPLESVRDGRDVATSMQYYKGAMPADRAEQFRIWADGIVAGERARQLAGDRCIRIRYEELTSTPQQVLMRVFQLIGIRSDSEIACAAIDKAHIERISNRGPGRHVRAGRVGDWKTVLGTEDLKIFERIAGAHARRLGYG